MRPLGMVKAAPSWSSSKEYREGYEQGVADAEMYDLGYYDGINGYRPKYSKDPDYMDGFKNGKKIRREDFNS